MYAVLFYILQAGRAGNDTKANMVIALKKLSVISSFINFESYKPWEIVCRLVKRVFRSNLVMSTEVRFTLKCFNRFSRLQRISITGDSKCRGRFVPFCVMGSQEHSPSS